MTAYDLLLELTKKKVASGKNEGVAEHVGTVRMSLQHAKVVAMVLKKNLHEFEEQAGTINIHPSVLHDLGLSLKEDW